AETTGEGSLEATEETTGEGSQEATEAPSEDPLLEAMREYQSGAGSVPVFYTNTTDDAVTVVATDENNNGYALYDIAAQQSAKHRAQPGTTLWFYKSGTDTLVGGKYTVEVSDGENVSIPVAVAKAGGGETAMQAKQRGEGSVEASFTNATEETVTVVVTDEQEQGHALFDMLPGDFFPMRVLPGAKLFFFKKGTADAVADPYEVTAVDGQQIRIAAPGAQPDTPALSDMQQKQQGAGSIEAIFLNTLQQKVTVVVFADEKAHPLFEIAAGETATQRVLPGSDLRFVDMETKSDAGEPYIVSGIDGERIEIVPPRPKVDPVVAEMQAKHSGPGSVEIKFTNLINAEVAVTVEDDNKRAIELYALPQGAVFFQNALPGTELWFYNKATGEAILPSYKVTEAATQEASVPNRLTLEQVKAEQAGPGSVTVSFHNTIGNHVEAVISDSAGMQVRLFRLMPGETTSLRMQPKTAIWFVKAGTDEVVPEGFVVPDTAPPGTIDIPYVPLGALAAAEAGPGSVPVTFINTGADDVAVTKLVSGVQKTLFYIEVGETVTYRLQPRSQIWFYKGKTEEAAGRDIPYYVRSIVNETVRLPYNPTDDELLAMNGINIDRVIADLTEANLNDDGKDKFCWRDSYGRGAGTVPRTCPPGQSEDTAGLCYTNCKAGYHPFVTMCVPDCPPGFVDDGLYCRKPAPQGRSAFKWELGDTPFSLDDARARCRASRDGKKYGCGTFNANTIVYSLCPSGYKTAPVVTSLCTPVCPPNTTDIGVSCVKHTYDRGVGGLMSCESGKQYDAGLCYNGCKQGFAGVGPVCWNQCPASLPYGCAAGCAKDKATCDWAIADQVTSPLIAAGSIAITVLTVGAGSGAVAAAKGGASAATIAGKTGAQLAGKAALREGARATLKAGVKAALQKMARAGALTLAKEVAIESAIGTSLGIAFYGGTAIAAEVGYVKLKEELKKIVRARMLAEVSDERIDAIVNTVMEGAEAKGGEGVNFPWSSLDPTGIADIVIAYNYPVCTDVK
ncbi:MAG: hypothetical protein AB7I52_14740, partial [Rhizobiaceae bacterium]